MKYKSVKLAVVTTLLGLLNLSAAVWASDVNQSSSLAIEKAKVEKVLKEKKAKKDNFLAKVNMNKANAEEIAAALKGIGIKKAKAIVDFRAKNGPFKSLEELTQVKGIGEKTLAANKEKIKL